MAIFRKPWRMAICVLLPGFLTACGAWQSVKDTTTETTRAVFIAKVKQMTLVIASRAALNQDPSGVSLPVVLRIYQLKDSKAFSTASYTQLLSGTGDVFNADILARTEVTLSPAATLTLSEPMSDDARYIGVVAFFRDQTNAEWQLVIPKEQWKKTDPVKLAVTGNRLELEAVR